MSMFLGLEHFMTKNLPAPAGTPWGLLEGVPTLLTGLATAEPELDWDSSEHVHGRRRSATA
ncbi:hypothetical protein DPMN_111135 [Dreissena polymorpha]|uniref:Uncharacterized protein n=1 Tax=Dreissena polymorpha TaxID=45954 RepID=A0A9D4QNQ1_DREPO|nr:hypothetical protein DPMN_111135 [Dreissena polymorpha]